MFYRSNTINPYVNLLVEALASPVIVNKRTGVGCSTVYGTRFFTMDSFELPYVRRFVPWIAAVEAAWQVLGTKNASFVNWYAPKLWLKFTDPNTGLIENAYGYRWRSKWRDQLRRACDTLSGDPTNRQIYISAWDPAKDGLGNKAKNVPCPVGFTLNIHSGTLFMSMFLRSSDLVLGLPYDIMCAWLTADMIAQELSCDRSECSFTLSNAHYYQPHEDVVKTMIDNWTTIDDSVLQWQLPQWALSAVETHPHEYVAACKDLWANTERHGYNPEIELVV